MKKNFILLISSTLLLSMLGCQTVNPNTENIPKTEMAVTTDQADKQPNEPQTDSVVTTDTQPHESSEPQTDQTETDNENQYCGYYPYDIDEYLRTEWENQYGQTGDAELNNQDRQVAIIVPVLKRNDYVLSAVTNPPGWERIEWSFIPRDKEGLFIPPSEIARVWVYTDPNYFDEALRIHGYHPDHSEATFTSSGWIIDYDEFAVEVFIPWLVKSEELAGEWPLERVYEFFDFEIVTYSPSAETNAPQ